MSVLLEGLTIFVVIAFIGVVIMEMFPSKDE